MSAGSIADYEREQPLWDWIENFPTALSSVFTGNAFRKYPEWENKWIAEHNIKYENELRQIKACLYVCE